MGGGGGGVVPDPGTGTKKSNQTESAGLRKLWKKKE